MISNFSLVYNSSCINHNTVRLSVLERDPSASLTSTHFNYDEFYQFSSTFYSQIDSLFSDKSIILNKGYRCQCDGAFLVKKDNEWILCLCELKSSMHLKNFLLAKLQMEVSYLKLACMMNILEKFDIHTIKCVLFLISNEPDSTSTNPIQDLRVRNTCKMDHDAYREFIAKKEITINDNTCAFMLEPIKKEFTTLKHKMHFIIGDNQEIELKNYLS